MRSLERSLMPKPVSAVSESSPLPSPLPADSILSPGSTGVLASEHEEDEGIPLDRTDSTSSSLRMPESDFEVPLGVADTRLALLEEGTCPPWAVPAASRLLLRNSMSSMLTLVLL